MKSLIDWEFNLPEELSLALSANGVRHAVVSSGSRSMPLVTALVANENIDCRMIVDERVAAFAAVGMMRCLHEPVAIVCTSGSAMLNYAPAVAEAFYQSLPLIVITADRPADRIDANVGQTIHQPGALANIVKQTFVLNGDAYLPNDVTITRANISTALFTALSGRRGPVHINVHLDEPLIPRLQLSCEKDILPIKLKPLQPEVDDNDIDALAEIMRDHKCMIYVGPGDFRELQEPLSRLYDSGVMIMTEVGSLLTGFNRDINIALAASGEEIKPDVLITIGGAPLSRPWCKWVKKIRGLQHVSISLSLVPPDTYYSLVRHFVADPIEFITRFADRDLNHKPMKINHLPRLNPIQKQFVDAPWSDLRAMIEIIDLLPDGYSLHCSNGSIVRLLNSYPGADTVAAWVNRGVNGIDGSTSTAMGFATVTDENVLLLTGDMSALYDIGALYSGLASPRFKMVIFNNGGGEIFRMINCTGETEVREQYLSAVPPTDWQAVGSAAGFKTFRAAGLDSLRAVLPDFFAESNRPALLEIVTEPGNSEVYNEIIKNIKS